MMTERQCISILHTEQFTIDVELHKNRVYAGIHKRLEELSELSLLLEALHSDVNTAAIRLARKNRDISLSQLREVVINVLLQIQNAYWDLLNTQTTLRTERQALQLAYDLLHANESKVEVGTLAPIEILSAKSEVASRAKDKAWESPECAILLTIILVVSKERPRGQQPPLPSRGNYRDMF